MVLSSPTLRCWTPPSAQWQIIAHARTFNSKTIPRVTDLCSAAHVAHKGSSWRSLKRCILTDLNKHEQTLDVGGGRPCRLSTCFEYCAGGEGTPPLAHQPGRLKVVEVGEGRGRENYFSAAELRVGLNRISFHVLVSDLGEWRHICHFFPWQKMWRVTFVTFLGRMWRQSPDQFCFSEKSLLPRPLSSMSFSCEQILKRPLRMEFEL